MPNSLSSLSGRNAVLAVALLVVLAACGGGGGGGKRRDGGGGNNGPQPPSVMGDTFAVTTANRLVFFNRGSGGTQSAMAISGLMAGDVLIGFDIRPANGSLVAVASSGRIYTLNSMTGAASLLSTISPADALSAVTGAAAVGVEFNPVPDRLRIITNSGKNLRVNVDTGVTTIDGDLTLNGSTTTGVVGAGYTNKVASACGTQLFYLDTMNNRLLTTADPNGGTLSVVGNLGVATSGNKTGFEIISAANGSTSAFVVLTVAGAPTVYSLNTMTGAVGNAKPIQGLTSGENVVGISATPLSNVPTAAGELTGLTSNNALFSFNSSDPTRVCSGPISITGLAAGENVVGIDVRPADQNLYGLGVTASGAGRVFQIDRTTGAISAAQAVVGQGGAAFTLSGTNFGIAFNPAVDLLRVVSDGMTNNNLRIDVTSGVVQNATMGGDTPIAGAVLSAAAYTNSLGPARPATTKLYTIDTAAAALNVQNPPNSGAQVRAAALTVPAATAGAPAVPIGTLAGARGFDINGADNTAFAGLAVGAMATNTTLYKINLDTGLSIPLGVIGAGTGAAASISGTVRGITLNAVPQATVFGVTADIRLISFKESSTGTLDLNVPISGLANGEDIKAIDVRPANGAIYAFTNQGATYILDPATGALSGRVAFTAAQPPLVPAPDPFTSTNGLTPGVDFNPVSDRLRLIDDPGTMLSNNLRIDVLNGATITDRNLTVGVRVTGAAYTAPAGSSTLYTLDTASDRLNMQVPANEGRQVDVGPLMLAGVRVDATDAGGFDIAGTNNFAVAVLATNASPGIAARRATVFTVDLATGTLVAMGAVNLAPGSAVTGLALPITPGAADGTIIASALVDGTALAQFAVNTPGTVTSRAITGLQAGEKLVGIDFRPSDGKLYGVGTSNRLYTIDTTTGAATQQGAPMTTPLDSLATSFGFDFDPIADVLRIVSDTRQNLRIDPATGAGVGSSMGADAPLVRGDPQPIQTFAAAHTNSFGVPDPSRMSQLFVVDAEANSLELQDGGALVLRGRLSTGATAVRFTGAGEFDIAGGDNGLALAALQPTGSMQSNLYRIDLATGLATQVGTMPIGPAGTQPLVGLTIVLR